MRSLFPGRRPRPFFGGVVAACLFAVAAHAQDAAILRKNTFEVGPFGGISYGVDHTRGMGGGNVTYSILSNILLYGEYSYFPAIEHQVKNSQQALYDFKIPLQDINFGVHARVRIPKTPLVPYAVFGIGLLHSPSVTNTFQTFNSITNSYGSPQDITPPLSSSTSFAVDYGAGVRLYIRENFGIRGEFKGYRLTGGPLHDPPSIGVAGSGLGVNQIFRATIGFFFQFP